MRGSCASFLRAFRSASNNMAAACFAFGWVWRGVDAFMAGMGIAWILTLSDSMRVSGPSPFDTHCSIFVILMVFTIVEWRVETRAQTTILFNSDITAGLL